MKVAVTLPTVFPERSLIEAMAAVADLGVDGVEFFDWTNTNLDTLVAARDEHELSFAATLAAGVGSSIEEGSPAMTDPTHRTQAIKDIKQSIETAAALDCRNIIVTVGAEQKDISRECQRHSVIDILQNVASTAEAADVTIVIEPLNVAVDHPGYFLISTAEAIDIIDAVDSPRIKLLYDIYHQQISEGNVIETLCSNIDTIGHVHIADVPGRHEPGSGELNYPNILAALVDAGYDGYVGCEFFPSDEPVRTVAKVVDLVDSASD